MTIITGRDFRANQGRYIGMAHRGEEVIITSKSGDVKLTPVQQSETEHVLLLTKSEKAHKEHLESKTLKFNSAKEAQRWMDEL